MHARELTASAAVAAGGALLFAIQPMIAKTLLPQFGGSAGVWVTSMMFFQVVLLLGYLYAYWITRLANPAAGAVIHLALLCASLAALPVASHAAWSAGAPAASILVALAWPAGLPFFVLSTTGPLVQSWCAGPRGAKLPYWLFAVSNTACLLALLAFPLAIEPALPSPVQLRWWSGAYAAVVLLVAAVAAQNRVWLRRDEAAPARRAAPAEARASAPLLWLALAACPSALWLAMANYLSREVAPIPFLWVLPLSVYLLSFVVCFGWEGGYRPALFRRLLPAAWMAIAWRIGWVGAARDVRVDLTVLLASLFLLCLFCNGELARRKPADRAELPYFYLLLAAGGALGGVFVALAAPALFTTYLELPVGVAATIMLAVTLIYGVSSRGRLLRMGALAVAAFIIASSFNGGATRVAAARNFYGTLEIRDSGAGARAVRTLYSGRTAHGLEFLDDSRRRVPTAYYGLQSGIGRLLDAPGNHPRRVAIIGLGAGTLAAYGRKGDSFRFYEIDPAVIEAAHTHFHFLEDSAAAIDVVEGDGRLRIAREPGRSLDAVVLDAFSDDAIPVHLLTREAFQLYFARLRPGSPLAIHLTNRYLDLNPVVESLARSLGKTVLRIHSGTDPEQQTLAADWAIVGDPGRALEQLRPYADRAPARAGPLWTDTYSNLFQVWR